MSTPHVKSRAECVARYGHLDFASKHWPDQSKWLKMLVIPDGMFPNWHVLDTKQPVHAIAMNIDCHVPFMTALNLVKAKNLGHLLKTFDGCFNIRLVRGSNTSFSAHSYGLAIDLNASENPLGATHGGFFDHPEFVKCFTDSGFVWGGSFSSRKDSMHFTWPGF